MSVSPPLLVTSHSSSAFLVTAYNSLAFGIIRKVDVKGPGHNVLLHDIISILVVEFYLKSGVYMHIWVHASEQ